MHQPEWERTKSYLIRSLFPDLPPLSPIPEEDSPSQISTRPYSPLPDLIIERIAPVNKHDEPEEFYQELDKKMKKLYRKLFLDDDGSTLDEVDDLRWYYGSVDDEDTTNSLMEVDQNQNYVSVHDTASIDLDYRGNTAKDRSKIHGEFVPEIYTKIRDDGEDIDSATFILDKVAQYTTEPDPDYVEVYDPNGHRDSSSQGTSQIITCQAQIHRVEDNIIQDEEEISLNQYEGEESVQNDVESLQDDEENNEDVEEQSHQDSEERSVVEEESQSYIWQTVESRTVTKRGEFIDIEISALAKGDSGESGHSKDSTPEVITLDSESGSCDTLEMIRHYNIRRHSMGSIRLSGPFGRQSSPFDLTFTRSRSLDPEIDVCRHSDLKNTEDINASWISHDSNGHSAEGIELSTETNDSSGEKIASGIAASTPMSTQWNATNSGSSTSVVDELNTARISTSFSWSNEENEFGEVFSAEVSSFPGKGVKRKHSAVESGRQKIMRVEMAQPSREISWDEIKNNFFVGNPTVYRVCSCPDHTCN
ncbi:uncharacterized protein LOC128670346 [Plodia interpunctella]|uniref:uncharacterized protein LOC128670346 n=1 Tax=Plodia interpunctella TaxID=58824 RepID=UPI0023685F23|nr:uncharacterized protein LOC128670346 [Plodia interpunctella]